MFRIVATVARNTELRSLILKILSTPLGILLRSLVRSLSRRHYALIDNDSLGSRSHSSGLRRLVTLRCPQAAESTPLLSFDLVSRVLEAVGPGRNSHATQAFSIEIFFAGF